MFKQYTKYIEQIELHTWLSTKKFFIKNRIALYFLLFLTVLLTIFSKLPYFNLIFNLPLNFFILLTFIIFSINLSGKLLLKLVLALFATSLFVSLLHREDIVEKIGEVTYLLLILTCLVLIKDFIKGEKK